MTKIFNVKTKILIVQHFSNFQVSNEDKFYIKNVCKVTNKSPLGLSSGKLIGKPFEFFHFIIYRMCNVFWIIFYMK